MENNEQKFTDAEISAKWRAFLKVFEGINPKEEGAKLKYLELKQAAENTACLTPRQREGINDRCDYRIFLIENPDAEPFANSEREEKRLQLSKEKSNGKQE